MLVAFILSMPSNNSWDGRWSGDDKLFAVVKSFQGRGEIEKARSILEKRDFRYSFGDGWVARIEVKEVNGAEAKTIRRKSQGFCGYDWMVNSIIREGCIR